MRNGKNPDPNVIHPIAGYDKEIYVKPTVKNPNIIVGENSVVGNDVDSYTIVVGNPARSLRKRFDDELIELLLQFKWWDRSVAEINALIPILTCSDLDTVREKLKEML